MNHPLGGRSCSLPHGHSCVLAKSPQFFHLLKFFFCFVFFFLRKSPVGVNGNLSPLDICSFVPGAITEWKSWSSSQVFWTVSIWGDHVSVKQQVVTCFGQSTRSELGSLLARMAWTGNAKGGRVLRYQALTMTLPQQKGQRLIV